MLEISKGIDELVARCRADGRSHDLTVGIGTGETGSTIHCNDDRVEIAGPALQRHCHTRKYTQHARTWFGICVSPRDTSLRFGLKLDYAWERDERMDALTAKMGKPEIGRP